MFGLFKILIVLVVLMVGVGFALEYLPASDASEWGKKAATYGMKGARGSMTALSAFVKEAKALKEKMGGDDEKPEK